MAVDPPIDAQNPEELASACADLHAHGPVPLPNLNPNLWAGKTVVFAGGGSAGHLMPGLALMELWREVLPDPPTVHWIGSPNRIEATLIPERGIPFHPLDITYFRRSFSLSAIRQNLSVLWRLLTGRTFRDAEAILREVDADLVVSLGSFVGGPVVVGAHHAGIPTVLMAMDAVIGKGHKWSAPVADAICASTEAGMEQLKRYRDKLYYTGTPVRPSLFRGDPVAARFEFGITAKKPTLLVVGGSQGAKVLNAIMPDLWRALNGPDGPGLNILHQAGESAAKEIAVPEGSAGSYAVKPFIANMANAYALADLVCCRAGANTIAELAALGKPSILVPFAASADGHQLANARAMTELGMAFCVTEDELTVERLAEIIRKLFAEPERLGMMQMVAQMEGSPGAASDVALVCEGVLARRHGFPERNPEAVTVPAAPA